jgi:hypothetical protein
LYADLGNGYPEVAIGRMPVNTPEELSVAVSRTLAYQGMPLSGQRALMVADLADITAGDFPKESDGLIASSPEFAWTKSYMGVNSDPATATEMMRQAASGGADIIMFNGHGNSRLLGIQIPRILDVNSVQTWTGNVILLQATCNGNFVSRDEQNYHSIAIQAMTQPQGGIAASISSTTFMLSQPHNEFMQTLLQQASGQDVRWGRALLATQQWAHGMAAAKRSSGNWYQDLANTECMLGDPALRVYHHDSYTGGAGVGSGPGGGSGGGTGTGGGAGGGDGTNRVPDGPIEITRFSGKADFLHSGRDTVALTGTVSEAAVTGSIKGVAVTADIAGAKVNFVLDAYGRGKNGGSSFRLSPKSKNGIRTLKIATRGLFWPDWSDEGITPTASAKPVTMNVTVTLNGRQYTAVLQSNYTAKAGRYGKFKALK